MLVVRKPEREEEETISHYEKHQTQRHMEQPLMTALFAPRGIGGGRGDV